MTVLNVPDMHCQNCVKRITNALNAAEIRFIADLDNHTVTIDGDEAAVARAKEELSDLGFEAE